MDKLLYVSMSGAKQTMYAQSANNHNMANANTTGFKADLSAFRSMPVLGEGYESRVYAMAERPGIDFTAGMVKTTGRQLDVAVKGEGWIAVQAKDGSEAYTRVGDLHLENGGLLVTGAGDLVMGNGGPIALPQAESISIGSDGTISIQPVGQQANALVVIDRIKLVNPDPQQLYKGEDGLMRQKNGADAVEDINVNLVAGALETSNVSMVDSLVNMIELSRAFEAQVKLMKTAEEMDESSNKLLRMS